MQELSPVQIEEIMKRFPNFELSYETVSHKKVSNSYNLCFAIPQGKKCYAWFTFLGEADVCFLFDLNRDKKIVRAYNCPVEFKQSLSLGTIFYGTLAEEKNPLFVVEDIYYFKGIPMKTCNTHQKLELIRDAMDNIRNTFTENNQMTFSLPMFWDVQQSADFELSSVIPEKINEAASYIMHHLQYRSLYKITPYMNVQINKKISLTTMSVKSKEKPSSIEYTKPVCDFSKPQYRYPTVFQVKADTQYDIYHLLAYGKDNKSAYCDVACVPNYKTSVFMNSLFRNIRENKNLDYIEESEDEEEFENESDNKYVDLEKTLLMECTFHAKFKKWVPMRVVNNQKIIYIGKLTRDTHVNSLAQNHNKDINFHNRIPRYVK
jgi:hypothetical protein